MYSSFQRLSLFGDSELTRFSLKSFSSVTVTLTYLWTLPTDPLLWLNHRSLRLRWLSSRSAEPLSCFYRVMKVSVRISANRSTGDDWLRLRSNAPQQPPQLANTNEWVCRIRPADASDIFSAESKASTPCWKRRGDEVSEQSLASRDALCATDFAPRDHVEFITWWSETLGRVTQRFHSSDEAAQRCCSSSLFFFLLFVLHGQS